MILQVVCVPPWKLTNRYPQMTPYFEAGGTFSKSFLVSMWKKIGGVNVIHTHPSCQIFLAGVIYGILYLGLEFVICKHSCKCFLLSWAWEVQLQADDQAFHMGRNQTYNLHKVWHARAIWYSSPQLWRTSKCHKISQTSPFSYLLLTPKKTIGSVSQVVISFSDLWAIKCSILQLISPLLSAWIKRRLLGLSIWFFWAPFFPPVFFLQPETNIAPENVWLEHDFPIGMAYFQVRTVSFREGIWWKHLEPKFRCWNPPRKTRHTQPTCCPRNVFFVLGNKDISQPSTCGKRYLSQHPGERGDLWFYTWHGASCHANGGVGGEGCLVDSPIFRYIPQVIHS